MLVAIEEIFCKKAYPNPMLIVPDITSCNRRVMADLLSNQVRSSTIINPFPQKDLSQEWIQWLHALLLPILILIVMLLP